MQIVIESLIEGAKRAKGLTVLIDVFRAFTVAAYVMNNGAKEIIPVDELEKAFALKKSNQDYVLMGERKGLKVEGFDYGNSPHEIKNIDFTEKTVIMTTSAGTQGIINAKNADEIILGNFVNIQSTIAYIENTNPPLVTLVALGSSGIEIRDEDQLCAEYIKEKLEGKNPDFNKIKDHLKEYKSALKFFDINEPQFPKDDFYYALDIDRFKFILKVIKKENKLSIIKEDFTSNSER
jgi:2-phosphosulfolactate phosphatase